MAYTLTQQEFRRLKTRLTRAINKGDAAKIVAECDYALGIFEEHGYPDDWHRWNIARYDAQVKIAREFADDHIRIIRIP